MFDNKPKIATTNNGIPFINQKSYDNHKKNV